MPRRYLSEKEYGEIILRLQQYYDVHYTEAIYYLQEQVFYFNFVQDNSAIVRVLSKGQVFDIVKEGKEWAQIDVHGKLGYVKNDFWEVV